MSAANLFNRHATFGYDRGTLRIINAITFTNRERRSQRRGNTMYRVRQATITKMFNRIQSHLNEGWSSVLSMYEHEVFQGKQENDGAGLRCLGHAWRATALRLWIAESSRADGSRWNHAGVRLLDVRVRKVQLLFERSKGSFVGEGRSRQQKGTAIYTVAAECELKVLHAIRATFTLDHLIQVARYEPHILPVLVQADFDQILSRCRVEASRCIRSWTASPVNDGVKGTAPSTVGDIDFDQIWSNRCLLASRRDCPFSRLIAGRASPVT